MKNNRERRASIAKETLKIIEEGFYINQEGERIEIKHFTNDTLSNTVLYTPESFDFQFEEEIKILIEERQKDVNTIFEVKNCTTLFAGKEEIKENKEVVCLNFASAKNPGGGFKGGSQAQEEALARASDLYLSLTKDMTLYETHRRRKDCLYTDHMIFSPKVTVFRADNDELLSLPHQLSFITSPAVNAGCIRQKYNKQQPKITPTMLRRMKRVLSVALKHQADVLVLGAWGCGVFQNDPKDMAAYFNQYLLQGGMFSNVFSKVVFAVLDNTSDSRYIIPFQKYFS